MAMGIAGARRQGVAGTGRGCERRTTIGHGTILRGKRHGHGLRPAEQCYIFDFRYRKYKYLRLPSPRIPAPPASWTSSRSSISCASPSAAASRAAEMLDVAQPTLSRQVRLLEQELGQHLLYRNGRGVEPTEAGLRFVEHARALLALAERAREDLRSLRETPAGKVSVGLPPRIARVLTPPLVQAFRREFPGASIAVAEGLSAQVREWLLAGRVDLALLYDPAPSPQLACESLFREDLVLAAAPALGPRCPHASRSGPGRLSAGAAQPAQRHPHTGRQRLPRPGRAPAGGGRGRRGADHRRAGRAGRCLRHPATLSRPGTGGRARWRWPISSPPHRQQPGAGDRPPPSLDAAGLGHRQTDTRAGTARPVRPGKSAKMPA